MENVYHIGGLFVRIESQDPKLLSEMKTFAPFLVEGNSSDSDICIRQTVTSPAIPSSARRIYTVENEGIVSSFYVTGDGQYIHRVEIPDVGYSVAVLDIAGRTAHYETKVYHPYLLSMAIWGITAVLASVQKRLFIHTSVVESNGKAILFLGESGTGKSTQSRLWCEHRENTRLLNDDSPIVGLSENGIVEVYGTPWSGKTPCYLNTKAPVCAIVRLSQAPENYIRKLSVREAFAALQPSAPPMLNYDDTLCDDVCSVLSDVIERVPCYHLACRPDKEAVEVLLSELRNKGI